MCCDPTAPIPGVPLNENIQDDLLHAQRGRALSAVMSDAVPGYLFENCFRDSSITVLVAPPHRGKTLLMLDMALCLDMELPLFGRFAPLRGRQCFFLGCDAPAWDYGLQARKLCIGHGISPAQRELLGIHGIWRRGFRLTDPEVREWLAQWRNASGDSVLFIDTHRATHGANENDSGQMEEVWGHLCRMRDQGWCIIMSHHTSKPSEVSQEDVHTGRGSTVIGASADFIYTLNKRSRKEKRVKVTCSKARGSAGDDDMLSYFDIEYVPSTELLNGKPLYGIQLLCGIENEAGDAGKTARTTTDIILEIVAAQPSSRQAIAAALVTMAPDFCKDRTAVSVQKHVDNRLQELRLLNKITSDGTTWRINATAETRHNGVSGDAQPIPPA